MSARSFSPLLPDLPRASLGNHGFHRPWPAHPPPEASYPISVRQVVAVAPASFRPRLTATPWPSLNGPDSLARRGLSPPRTGACPAYHTSAPAVWPGRLWWRGETSATVVLLR